MDPLEMINENVDVAMIFSRRTGAVPRKMSYRGREILFTRLGLRHPTRQGLRMIHVFDMSDGANDYRLEFDSENLSWKLISMIPGDLL